MSLKALSDCIALSATLRSTLYVALSGVEVRNKNHNHHTLTKFICPPFPRLPLQFSRGVGREVILNSATHHSTTHHSTTYYSTILTISLFL